MRTARSSSGWRNASSALGANSPSSSRNRTPRCARVISPGRARPLPPPTSAAVDAVWCGARNGRRRDESSGDRLARRRVDAGDLERLGVRQGREDGAQPPGQHRLAGAGRPAEQEVMTARGRDLERLARERQPADVGEVDQLVVERCARRGRSGSARADPSRATAPRPSGTRAARRACAPPAPARRRRARPRRRWRAGTTTAPTPARASASTSAKRARHRPDRAVEAELAEHRDAVEHAGRERVVGARAHRARPRARAPIRILRTPPGARFTVIRRCGHSRPDDSTAARTRSRDSRTAASGSPTTWYAGRPDETWTSTVTGCPSTPMSVALRTAASTATSRFANSGRRAGTAATSTVIETFAPGCDVYVFDGGRRSTVTVTRPGVTGRGRPRHRSFESSGEPEQERPRRRGAPRTAPRPATRCRRVPQARSSPVARSC